MSQVAFHCRLVRLGYAVLKSCEDWCCWEVYNPDPPVFEWDLNYREVIREHIRRLGTKELLTRLQCRERNNMESE